MKRHRLRFRGRVPWAYVAPVSITVIGAIVLPTIISRVKAGPRQEPAPLRHAFGTIADDLGSWSRAVGRDGKPRPDAFYGVDMKECLGTNVYLDRHLADGDRQIKVFVTYHTGEDQSSTPCIPERCWNAAGRRKSIGPQVVDLDLDFDGVTAAGSPVHLPVGTPDMTITQFDIDDGNPGSTRVGGYLFIVDGRLTSDLQELRGLHGYHCKVQLEYSGTRQDGEGSDAVFAEFVEIAEDLLPSLLSEIMHCLPDSSGIEGSAGPVESVGAPPVEATRPRKMIPR
ncbi:MAG: hypothetical protein GY895_03150, partial [Phycisphaera sp.]|nr:hypothetical protein [Phycisphaera sp.]